ncbi:hypothetical protein A1332_12655 [Methylomonas methanica]|uniref:Uncharacterized protein n=1 Tax=Methylomonas methanica TaxID=421 RepID=A0A177ML38_METMH|nr:hypothetical protein A1332_12655 [Methylomonas methanica]
MISKSVVGVAFKSEILSHDKICFAYTKTPIGFVIPRRFAGFLFGQDRAFYVSLQTDVLGESGAISSDAVLRLFFKFLDFHKSPIGLVWQIKRMEYSEFMCMN